LYKATTNIVQSDHQLFLEQTAKDLADEAQSSHGWTVPHKFLSKGRAWQCDIWGQEYFLWNRFCEGYLGGESREKVKAVTLVML
jgi:hypothetical protein